MQQPSLAINYIIKRLNLHWNFHGRYPIRENLKKHTRNARATFTQFILRAVYLRHLSGQYI